MKFVVNIQFIKYKKSMMWERQRQRENKKVNEITKKVKHKKIALKAFNVMSRIKWN